MTFQISRKFPRSTKNIASLVVETLKRDEETNCNFVHSTLKFLPPSKKKKTIVCFEINLCFIVLSHSFQWNGIAHFELHRNPRIVFVESSDVIPFSFQRSNAHLERNNIGQRIHPREETPLSSGHKGCRRTEQTRKRKEKELKRMLRKWPVCPRV